MINDVSIRARVNWGNRWLTRCPTRDVWYRFIWRYLCQIIWIRWVLWRWGIRNWLAVWINWDNLLIWCIGNRDGIAIIVIMQCYLINISVILAIFINIRNVTAVDNWRSYFCHILFSS